MNLLSNGTVEMKTPNDSALLVHGAMNLDCVVSHGMIEMQIPNSILLVHGVRNLAVYCIETHGFNAIQITNCMLIHAILSLWHVVSKGARYY